MGSGSHRGVGPARRIARVRRLRRRRPDRGRRGRRARGRDGPARGNARARSSSSRACRVSACCSSRCRSSRSSPSAACEPPCSRAYRSRRRGQEAWVSNGGPCGVPRERARHTRRPSPSVRGRRCGTARGIGGFRIRLLANPVSGTDTNLRKPRRPSAPASVKIVTRGQVSVNRAGARLGTRAATRSQQRDRAAFGRDRACVRAPTRSRDRPSSGCSTNTDCSSRSMMPGAFVGDVDPRAALVGRRPSR